MFHDKRITNTFFVSHINSLSSSLPLSYIYIQFLTEFQLLAKMAEWSMALGEMPNDYLSRGFESPSLHSFFPFLFLVQTTDQ